jgi:predicted aspartyl protease
LPHIEYDSFFQEQFFVPIVLGLADPNRGVLTSALVDTGATKCMILSTLNEQQLHLPIVGTDRNVGTANGPRDLDYVKLPVMVLANAKVTSERMVMELGPLLTDFRLSQVETWLGDMSIVGMNFLEKFDVSLKRNHHIVFEV